MYLIWLAFFGKNGFGFGSGDATQNVEVMSKLNSLERQAQDNHNNMLAYDAIKGNSQAITELASNLNVGVSSITAAVANVQNAIGQVSANVGISGERVINAIGQGNLNMIQMFKDCCCSTQKEILKMGYENQIGVLNQTNTLQSSIAGVANSLNQGITMRSYEAQRQTNEIINAGTLNTQRIIDTLQNHWQENTAKALQDAKFEISQLQQTQKLIDALKTTTTTT